MYSIAWQSMLIEALVFVVLGITFVVVLRLYARKHAANQSLDSHNADSATQDSHRQDKRE